MKKNYLQLVGSFVLSILVILGCQKVKQNQPTDQPVNSEISSQSKQNDDDDKNECRLTFGTNADPTGSANFTFHYNNKGLADKWDIENYGSLAQQYDAQRRLKKAILTQNGVITNTISFFYNGDDQVIKQVWFYGTTTDTNDIIFYHYDVKGNLIKAQSFMGDYYATGKYSPDGSLTESKLFFSGVPVYAAIYTYDKPFKNPYLAVPGVDNLYPYYTPMDLFYGKWRFASLKQLAYDENGNPIVTFQYNPSKTLWRSGSHNYPSLVTYFDVITKKWFPYRFDFENCGKEKDDNDKISDQKVATPTTAGRQINLMLFLKRDASKAMKEKVHEFRQQLKNIKN